MLYYAKILLFIGDLLAIAGVIIILIFRINSYAGRFCSGDLHEVYGDSDKILKNRYSDLMLIRRGRFIFGLFIYEIIYLAVIYPGF